MDLWQLNYVDKIYLGLSTFPTALFNNQDLYKCLSASCLSDNAIINNFLQEEMHKKDITIVSTRFFVDVKIQKYLPRFLRVFSLKEHMDKRLICMSVLKNNNHWYLIVIFPKSHSNKVIKKILTKYFISLSVSVSLCLSVSVSVSLSQFIVQSLYWQMHIA